VHDIASEEGVQISKSALFPPSTHELYGSVVVLSLETSTEPGVILFHCSLHFLKYRNQSILKTLCFCLRKYTKRSY